MEITQIRYFLEVAESQHMTRSAEKLHIAQPALSQTIKRFEESLGVKLFEAQGRNIVLTDCGRYLKQELEPIVQRLDRIPEELQEMSKLKEETIHLNVLAASTLITQSIIEFRKMHRDVNFNLVKNEEYDSSDIEISTKLFYQANPLKSESEFVCPEQIYLAVPRNERYKNVNSISLKEAENEKFISLAGPGGFRSICDTFCTHAGVYPNIVFESDNPTAVKNMIAANIGIGFWPEYTWGKVDSRKVRLLKIDDPVCSRDLVVTMKVKGEVSKNRREYFEFLKEYMNNQRNGRLKDGDSH